MKKIYAFLTGIMLLSSVASYGQVDFREESIYFLMTTRFFDGDPNNNAPTEWSSYNPDPNINPSITDPEDVTWRGDFKGLIQKLDYIQDLGFTAIWITPIVQNRGPLDYHGYHAWDFTKVDPRLESPGATFQDLINEVHARGMKIVLDVVTNHSGRFGIKGVAEIKYNTDPTQASGQDLNGNPLQDNPNWEYDGLTPNPDDGKIWSRANLTKMPAPYNQDLSQFQYPGKESYVDTSDPNWYHHSGNGFAQGFDDIENLHNRALAGDTPDLNTGSQVVRDYLVAAYTTFINMGVDGLRWDTMKHMSKEDVLYFYDEFKAVNPDLFIFGEVAQLRHELHQEDRINPHYYTWRGEVNNSANSGIAVIDFFGHATFHGVFEEGQNFSNVTAAARYDHLYSDPSTLLTWLDNHDFGPNNDWNRRYSGSDENLAACLNFMFTWRGIPIVYYGTESRFMAGEFADIHNAAGIQQSIDLTGRAYYGAEFDNAPNHIIYQHLKKLNAIRRAIPALQKGSWRWDGNGGGNGIGYVRTYQDSEVAVGLAKDGAVDFNFSGLTNGIYRDAVTGNEISVDGGNISFRVERGSAGIYVRNGPGRIGANGAGFFQAGSGGGGNPIVSVNPQSGHYTNGTTVSMSVQSDNPADIYYTLDGATPNPGSTRYTGSFQVTDPTTVKAIAIDNQGNRSVEVSRNYTTGELTVMSVYFEKPGGWGNPNLYHWNASPAGILGDATWPGPEMIDEGDGWYRYDFNGIASTNLIFSDGGNNQTADLSRAGSGWYDLNGVWHDQDPRGPTAPELAVNPAGGNHTTGTTVNVSLSISNGVTGDIYYTNDGSTPSGSSTAYTGPLAITQTTNLRAIVISSVGLSSNLINENYVFSSPPAGLTVHFKPETYSDPEIYFWAVTPSGQQTSWPGVTMTAEADGWYGYTLPNATCANIIFSNNGAQQTPDLNRCAEGWYLDGQWYDQLPGTGGSNGLTILFRKPNNWGTANMHYWNVTPAGTANTNWPGVQMTDQGDGWWSYTIPNANCANIVFSDNGGSQTTDLFRCGDGAYDNGWSNNGRTGVVTSTVTDVISETTLGGSYPNPATGISTIDFSLEEAANVNITLFDLHGKQVETLVNGSKESGQYSITFDSNSVKNGIYVYVMTTSTGDNIRHKMVVRN